MLCEDSLPNLKRYTDKEVIQDRIDFYSYQDEWARTNSGLYKLVFLVSCPKYNWKKMRVHLDELMSSELSTNLFNDVSICNYDGVSDNFNRSICGFVDISKMLESKYENNEYYSSRVLWYDNDIPKEAIPKQEDSGIEERRQS